MPFAVAAVASAAVGAYGAYKSGKAGKKAQRSADYYQGEQLKMQKEQLALSKAEDDRRKKIIKSMLSDATLTDEKLQSGIDDVTADVKGSFQKGRSELNRNLRLSRVNPSSGASAKLNQDFDLKEAIATAGSKNRTRKYLKAKEKFDIQNVKNIDVGVTPLSLGVMGGQSGQLGNTAAGFRNDAARYRGDANSSLIGGIGAAGQIIGNNYKSFSSKPAPIDDYSQPLRLSGANPGVVVTPRAPVELSQPVSF